MLRLPCSAAGRIVVVTPVIAAVKVIGVREAMSMIVIVRGQHASGRPRVDLRDDLVAARINHGNLVGVVLCHEQPGPGPIERHAEAVAVELDTGDQVAGAGRGDVYRRDFTVPIGRHVDSFVAVDHDAERESSANACVSAFVVREERTQIVLVAHSARRGVDHRDGVVVVVGDDQASCRRPKCPSRWRWAER